MNKSGSIAKMGGEFTSSMSRIDCLLAKTDVMVRFVVNYRSSSRFRLACLNAYPFCCMFRFNIH